MSLKELSHIKSKGCLLGWKLNRMEYYKSKQRVSFWKSVQNTISSLCNCLKQSGSLVNKQLRILKKMKSSSKNKKLQIPDQNERNKGKKTLVLDLDETLVHSSHVNNHSDFSLSVKINDQQKTIYINKRPYVEEFIQIMSEYYEIVVFTASLQEYAEPAIDAIDKYKKIDYKLYRENCTYWNGMLVKDMTKLNRNIRNIILIDNSDQSTKFQPENSILIKSFFGEENDKELEYYIPFLICLSKIGDIRPIQEYQKRFYLNKKFEVYNSETKEKQSIDPNEYFENWKYKKLKSLLKPDFVESYAETPVTQETDILINKDMYTPSKFSPLNKNHLNINNNNDENNNNKNNEFQQQLMNIAENQLMQIELNESQEDNDVGSEFPEQHPRDIFKNLKISPVRGQISNLNINSPLNMRQVVLNQEEEELQV